MKRQGRAAHLLAWTKSPTWRAIASRRAKANLAEFAKRPRCGATCRSTGEPCRNPVITGRTRCRFHGGVTGRGREWHRMKPVADPHKANRKIAHHIRSANKRAKRVAAMTPEQRAAFDRWQATHTPDSPEARSSRRALRRQNLDARRTIEQLASKPATPKTDLEIEIERLKDELEQREQFRKGVFE